MKFFTREIKIAMVAIVAVLIVYFGIIFLKGVKLASTDNVYYITMSDVSGLSPQAEVLANGMNIGTVKRLSFNPATQLVAIAIELDEGYTITEGSTATLQKDMLGAPKVRVMLGKDTGRLLEPGDTIRGFPMSDLMASMGDMVPSFEALIPKVDSLLAALNALASNPAIAQSLANLEYVTNNLRTTSDRLNVMMETDIPQMMAHVNAVGGNLAQTTDKLNQVDFAGMAAHADAAVGQLQVFTNRLNNENSTLGRLMTDSSVYDHLDSTVYHASLLLQDLREHPKRYVHFSVFGKKDK